MSITYDSDRRPRLLSDAFRRRWPVLALAAALGLGAGIGLNLLKTPTYDATTTVLVNPLPGNPFHQQSQNNLLVDMSTEAEVVRSDPVASRVVPLLTALGYDKVTVAGLISHVRAELQTNTQVLLITTTARSKARARDSANSFATAYLAYRESNAKQDNVNALQEIAAERKRDQQVVDDLKSSLTQADPASSTAAKLQSQIKTTDQQLNDLAVREADIQKRKTVPGVVLSPAVLPQTPHGVNRHLLALVGLLLGLVAGVVVAVGLERTRGRIRHADAIPSELDVLAEVHPSGVPQPVMLTAPDHASAEAYRLLYLGVDAAVPRTDEGTVVIAIASLADPAPPIAVNLALAAAEFGRVTTLVDALPPGSGAKLPGLPVPGDAAGLSEVILEGRDPVAARQHVTPRLTYLAPGRSLPKAAEAYAGPRMRTIVDTVRRACDLVVLAVPSLTNPDGQALASLADAVVLVVPLGTATLSQLEEAAVEARRVHATIAGVVAAAPGRSRRSVPAPAPTSPPDVVVRDEQPPASASRITS